ncbi:MAG: TonB-dependent receptor [Calditrichaeota bacterium]|nr:TonB-dependent receptor [Calditrichota bacterium]MCB9367849.1 TonB-dependent receptor [Calditrichota bacterium]
MKPFSKRFVRAVLFLCSASLALAQGIGKLSGVVSDAATGDPIPAANVSIDGTTRGATTDVDGEFFVLNLPIGTYSVRVSTIGFVTQVIEGVVIESEETTELAIKLTETVLEGKEVVIQAERDVIKRDVANTVRSVDAREITELPVTQFSDALAKQAGVVGSGDNLHIRGGRRDEILFLVDGLAVRDPQFQRRYLEVPKSAIGEMQVMTAGFNAEYGEAQSAVVNLITKDGEPSYTGHVEHVMDVDGLGGTWDNLGKVYLDEDGSPLPHQQADRKTGYQDYDYTEMSFSGPEPITSKLLPKMGVEIPGRMSMFGSGTFWGRNTNEFGTYIGGDKWYRPQVTDLFGSDVRKAEVYNNTNLKLTFNSDKNYKISAGWMSNQERLNPYWYRLSQVFPYNFSLAEQTLGMHALAAIQGLATNADEYPQLTLQDLNGDGVVDGADERLADDDGDGRIDEEALNWVDDDGDGRIDEDLQSYVYNPANHTRTELIRDQQMYVTLNHTLNSKTYQTVRIGLYDASRTLSGGNKAANEYGMASEPYVDLPEADGIPNGRYDIGEPFTDLDGDGMWDYNNPSNAYPNVYGFHIAGDGLAGNNQQLVPDWAKFKSQTYTLKYDITSQLTVRHQVKAGLEYNYFNVSAEDRPYPTIDNGGEGIYTDVYRYYPTSGAAYLQDKMEYRDIIINAGLRLDYWRIGGDAIRNPLAQDPTLANYVDFDPPSKSGDAYLSPRLGIAYSVTDHDVFHFNYGYFYQRGQQDYYLTGVNQLQTGGTPVIGNPDLKPSKTIAYELGVRHQFANDYLLDVSTYYKDIKNWIQTASQNQLFFDLGIPLASRQNAAIYYNADYASVRGFEFNLSKDYGSYLSGRVTYTLSWASGKNSYNNGSQVTRSNYVEPAGETPLAWDRRHQIVFNLGTEYPLKGKAFSMEWLRTGWTINLLSQLLSGLPYTPTQVNGSNIEGQEFSENTPWTYSTDLNIGRHFAMGGLNWQALLEIRNVFNTKNILGWDRNQDTIDTYLDGEPGYINDSSSPNYGLNPHSGANPDAWDNPRLVRVGLAVDF